MSPPKQPVKEKRKRAKVSVEFRNGITIEFGGSKDVLGGLIELFGAGLRPLNATKTRTYRPNQKTT